MRLQVLANEERWSQESGPLALDSSQTAAEQGAQRAAPPGFTDARELRRAGIPTPGSVLHATGNCRPCAWHHKPKGCYKDLECMYCHLCDKDTLKKIKQAKARRIAAEFALEGDGEFAPDQMTEAQVSQRFAMPLSLSDLLLPPSVNSLQPPAWSPTLPPGAARSSRATAPSLPASFEGSSNDLSGPPPSWIPGSGPTSSSSGGQGEEGFAVFPKEASAAPPTLFLAAKTAAVGAMPAELLPEVVGIPLTLLRSGLRIGDISDDVCDICGQPGCMLEPETQVPCDWLSVAEVASRWQREASPSTQPKPKSQSQLEPVPGSELVPTSAGQSGPSHELSSRQQTGLTLWSQPRSQPESNSRLHPEPTPELQPELAPGVQPGLRRESTLESPPEPASGCQPVPTPGSQPELVPEAQLEPALLMPPMSQNMQLSRWDPDPVTSCPDGKTPGSQTEQTLGWQRQLVLESHPELTPGLQHVPRPWLQVEPSIEWQPETTAELNPELNLGTLPRSPPEPTPGLQSWSGTSLLQPELTSVRQFGVEEVKDDMTVLSVGSLNHSDGSCQPCAWFWKPVGCRRGLDCNRCHLCPQDRLKVLKKERVAALKAENPRLRQGDDEGREHDRLTREDRKFQ